jgi:hypothetical protein
MITIIAILVAVITTVLISRYLHNKKIAGITEAHKAELIAARLQMFNDAHELGMMYKRTEEEIIAEMLKTINS